MFLIIWFPLCLESVVAIWCDRDMPLPDFYLFYLMFEKKSWFLFLAAHPCIYYLNLRFMRYVFQLCTYQEFHLHQFFDHMSFCLCNLFFRYQYLYVGFKWASDDFFFCLGMVTSKVGKRHALSGFEALQELFIARSAFPAVSPSHMPSLLWKTLI
jgi:hypothetical protein